MSESTSQLKIGAALDGSFETTTTTVKRKIGELGTAATSTGKSLAGMGDGTAQSAQKVEQATKSMIQSIQRTTAATEAGDKSTRAYQESLARMRGIDVAALKPYLDQLDSAKMKAAQAATANNSLGDSFAGLGSRSVIAAGAIGAIGAALSAAFSAASIKGVIDVADNFSKLAQKSGVAVEALRELNYAASLSDVSTEALGTGLRKLSQNMAAAAGGGKEQAAAFAAVGVSVKGVDGALKGADVVLSEVAAKFATFKDGPEKAALAIELFGKAGADMIPLLNSGATGLAEMAKEANDLGVVFSSELAKSAEAFNDNLTRIQASTEGTKIAIANELLPTLNLLAQVFLDAKKESSGFGGFIGGALKTIIEAATILYSDVAFVLKGIGREFGAIGAQVVALGRLDIKGFSAISQAVKEDGIRARAELDKFQLALLNSGILNSKAGAGRGTADDPRLLGDTKTVAPIVSTAGADALKKSASEAAAALKAQDAYVKSLEKEFDTLRNGSAASKIHQAELLGIKGAKLDNVKATIAMMEAMKDGQKAAQAHADAHKKESDGIEAYMVAQTEGYAAAVKGSQDALAAAKDEYDQFGLTKSQIAAITLVRLEDQLVTKTAGSEAYEAIQKQIEAQRELISVMKGTEGLEASKKINDEKVADWKKTIDQYDDIFRTGFSGMINGGQGAWKSFTKSLATTFKTSVADQIYKTFAQPFVVRFVASMLGITGVGSAVAQEAGGGIASSIGLSAAISKAGAYVAEGASTVATAILGFGADALAFEGGMAMMGSATGVTSFMAGAGQAMAAMGPVGWAALAAVAVIAALGLEGGETRNGAQYGVGTNGLATKLEGPSGGEIASKQAREMFDITKSSIEGMLTGLGSKAVLTGFTAGLESSENGKGFAYATGQINGQSFGDVNTYMNNRGDKTQEQALADYKKELSQSILEALQVTADIPASVAKLIRDGLNGSEVKAMSADAVNAILANVSKLSGEVNTFNAAMTQLPFEALKNLSFDTAAGLIAAAGGFEKLDANLGGFYASFYTAEEQRAQSVTNTEAAFKALGLTMPTLDEGARAAYRSMVELAAGQDLSIEANAKSYAGLLALQGPMSQLAPTFESIAQAAVDAVAKMKAAAANATSVAVQLGLTTAIDVARNAANEAWTAFKTALPQASGFSQAEIVNFARDPSKMGALSAADQAVINTFVTAIGAWSAAQQSGSTASGGSSGTTASTAYADTLTGIKDQTADFLMQLANVGKDSYTAALQKIKTDAAAKLKELDALGGSGASGSSDYTMAGVQARLQARNELEYQQGKALREWKMSGNDAVYSAATKAALDAYNAAVSSVSTTISSNTAVVNAWAEAQTKLLTAQKAEGERVSLQDRLNALTDTNAQALARQRDALEASNKVLFDQVQLATAAAAAAQERKGLQDQYDQLTMTSAQLLAKQRAELSASNQALFDSIQAIKAETAAREAAKTAASDAYSTLQRAVDAQRKIVQVARDAAAESVSSLTSIFDILQSSVKELYGTVDSTAQMQSDQGRAFIRDALTAAQRTGYLPESKALSDAINAAKGGTKEFASQFEKDFAALTLAGDLSLMETLTKGQLTEAQKALKAQEDQLTALDNVLTNAKLQLDAANGINTSVLSVAAALAGYNTSITALIVANGVNRPTTTTGTGGGGVLTPTSAIAGLYQSILGRAGDTGGIAFYQGLLSSGTSLADVAAQIAASTEARNRVPGYAVGTNYVPNDGLAYLHEGEAVIPKAYNPMAGGSGNGSARTDALLEGLTKEVQRLQGIVNDGNNHARRTADTLDNVTEGGSNMRTVAL